MSYKKAFKLYRMKIMQVILKQIFGLILLVLQVLWWVSVSVCIDEVLNHILSILPPGGHHIFFIVMVLWIMFWLDIQLNVFSEWNYKSDSWWIPLKRAEWAVTGRPRAGDHSHLTFLWVWLKHHHLQHQLTAGGSSGTEAYTGWRTQKALQPKT